MFSNASTRARREYYGEPLSVKAEPYLDDIYRRKAKAQPAQLT